MCIGCGPGRFSVAASQDTQWKHCNHLGLEIREPLVTRANAWVKKLNLRNCHFIHCNANVSLENILKNYHGDIILAAVQFPDPHFKKKHQKRRVVTERFVSILARFLKPGTGKLFMQSDVEAVAAQMRVSNQFIL